MKLKFAAPPLNISAFKISSNNLCNQVAAEDAMCGKGYELTLFLFTDIIVVAKVSH